MDIFALRAFLSVARHLSFAQASHELAVKAPYISKSIARLESHLGKTLFLRSTRSVQLSADGERFLPLALHAFDALAEARDIFQKQGSQKIEGKIRVTAPQTLAQRVLAPKLAAFHAMHPAVEIEFLLSDSFLDLVDNKIDVAFRVMALHDSSLKALKIAENPLIFCASPKYLKSAPKIKKVADLAHHSVLAIAPHMELRFRASGKRLSQHVPRPWLMASNGDLLVEQARLGAGVLLRSRWGVAKELASGELIEIKVGDELKSDSAVYLIYPEQRFMPQRTRVFLDYFRHEFLRR